MVTTLSVEPETLEQLEEYRAEDHHSWDDVVSGMMKMLPTFREVRDGCVYCDDDRIYNGTPEDTGGVVQFFHTSYNDSDVYGSNYFCSPECAHEAQQEVEEYVPETPDKVLVGGKSEMRAEFVGATFYLDGERMEVSVSVPGAFAGSDSHGNDYDYHGEPVYIYNEGRVVQKGVIEDIIHEETHTALILGHDRATVMLNHPNDKKRVEYEEVHANWTDAECYACGTTFKFTVGDPPEECPNCGFAEW